ncbi:ECF transporter S component [Microbacterium sp. P07]|uniref:ECF transporter S component n=1 Tax=Microbacterium sp. P07 TaxID=3366952 RepID=UPI0037477D27
MAAASRLSTRVLLVCAAIGVATGLVGGVAGWVTPVVIAGLPIVYGFVLGVHVIPGIISQELLRLPLVALITHVLAALVSSAVAPQFALSFLGTAVLFGGVQEGVAALTRYRVWRSWRFFISALVIGAIIAVAVGFIAHLSSLAPWAGATYLVLAVLGPVVWTAVALAVGGALRRTGVGRVPGHR